MQNVDRSDLNSCMEYVRSNQDPQIIKSHNGVVTTQFEAGTGSWYGVVVAPMIDTGRFGGDVLISVLSPWNTAYPMNPHPGNWIHASYIVEKLIPTSNPSLLDVAALTQAINLSVDAYFGVTK